MKRKALLLILVVAISVAIGAVLLTRQEQSATRVKERAPVASPAAVPSSMMTTDAAHVPAHYETPPASLAPTLPPVQFSGMTREAYQAAKEIPQTLAQLPCYCHCDVGFGHKSLQSCFVDDHAAHCAVCVNEALAAYNLQKEGLTPAQIRDRIIAEYAQQ